MTIDDIQPKQNAARLTVCMQAVSTFFDERLEALCLAARESVLVAARDAGERDEEEHLLLVMEVVENLCSLATEAFRNALMMKIRTPGGGLEVKSANSGGGLDLVETATLDD
ncbi:MAG: hypothetical protein ACI8W7_004308, partial [Gammaproteobacteria bacterium]